MADSGRTALGRPPAKPYGSIRTTVAALGGPAMLAVAPSPSTRMIRITNFRDVGGHPTRDGATVRRGVLYRSTDLGRVPAEAVKALAGLGIRTVFDLRTAEERERWPAAGMLPTGAEVVVADVLRDAPESTPARIIPLLSTPERAQEILGDGRAERILLRKYREFVNLASARQAYHRVLSDLAVPARLPAIVHCMTGKDRTGWLVAVLLLLLGVPEDVVMDDFLASNAELEGFSRVEHQQFAELGGDPRLLEPFNQVRPAYLQAALDEMRRGFGSIDGYVDGGLAIGPVTRRHLLANFLGA
jgi:protein-tyrosine phosphatase